MSAATAAGGPRTASRRLTSSRIRSRSSASRWGRLKTGTPPRLHRAQHRLRWRVASGEFFEEHGRRRAGAVLVRDAGRSIRNQIELLAAAHERSRARSSCARTSRQSRCSTDRFRASARATARRSKTRSCGSPTGAAPDLPRAGRLDVDEIYVNGLSMSLPARRAERRSSGRCLGSRTPRSCVPAMRSSTTSSSRPSCSDARNQAVDGPLPRRTDQRHVRLRGSGRAGADGRYQRRAGVAGREPLVDWAATRRTSASSSTTS